GTGGNGGDGQGGGLFTNAAGILDCSFVFNTTQGGTCEGPTGGNGGNAQGGGLYLTFFTSIAKPLLINDTIFLNNANGGNGANRPDGIAGNGGNSQGGGIFVPGVSVPGVATGFNCINSTINANTTLAGSGGHGRTHGLNGAAQGGGVWASSFP